MSPLAAGIVLFAALLHALWNALVKGALDRTVILGFVPPPALAAVPYIIASTVIHWAYYVFLNMAYRYGDLSFAYPVARGLAPILISLGALIWADELLPTLAWIGVATVSIGILTLVSVRKTDPRALGSALIVSVIIAADSIVDGLGIRISGSPVGYVAWLYIAEIFVAIFVIATRSRRLRATPRSAILTGLAGGLLSALAYGLVLYAKTLAPLGIVSAFRETSVIFAALIGVLWFGEGPAKRRLTAGIVVAVGIVLLSAA